MDRPRFDFGDALGVDAEAVGQPGQRRFRLLVRGANQSASIWMEKQQLIAIGTWLEEMFERLDKERPDTGPDTDLSGGSEPFEVDFRAAQIALGYAEERDVFAIQAFDPETTDRTPTFSCFVTRSQARPLARKIAEVGAAGRQICPLCDLPMEPEGHVCPRSNGHHPATV